jgi:hypothetical protein
MKRLIPNIIWTLWLQGWDEAPEVVQTCLKTWQAHNPDWRIQALSSADLDRYLDATLFNSLTGGKDIQPEALSDIIRILLLERYGGVWVDSTVYCLKPLDAWLPEKLAGGFFAFAKPGPDRMLSTWFIAAAKGHYIVQEWHRRVVGYWARRWTRHHYFWFHYLFTQAYKSDSRFRASWDATPEVLADGPHYYAPYTRLAAPVSGDDLQLMETPPTPLLKLTHKLPPVPYAKDSVLTHLRAQAEAAGRRLPGDHRDSFAMPRDVLVAWYGSFEGHGTIGDLLAMQSVVTHLVGIGHNVVHASAGDVAVVGARRVEWRTASPESFDACIFVCGPVLKGHPATQALFARFAGVHKIGVGVSLFPPEHENHLNPFDEVLAREGRAERFQDLAIVAPSGVHPRRRKRRPSPTIGLALRGPQGEYGQGLCLWERTEQIAHEAAEHVLQHHGGRMVTIENHLQRSGRPPEGIEAQYADCDLIITSRFHGAMLALRHLVPFIAIDQIRGGAKVLNLVGATRWPYVFEASAVDAARMAAAATDILSGTVDPLLFDVRARTVAEANRTLTSLTQLVRALPIRRAASRLVTWPD